MNMLRKDILTCLISIYKQWEKIHLVQTIISASTNFYVLFYVLIYN